MARIAGVDLPRRKRVEIGLTYIYGIGKTTSRNILARLDIDPNTYKAETDERVQVRVGARSLTATDMLASLNDDKIELKSNVRGKIAP